MEMKKRGMSALALLGSLLLMSGAVQASETLNTILGGGAGGVAGTMIGKELGGDTGALVGAALGGAAGGAATANLLNLNLKPNVVYRITALAYGRKGNTMAVLQQTYARQFVKD